MKGADFPKVFLELTPKEGADCLADLAASASSFFDPEEAAQISARVKASRAYVVPAHVASRIQRAIAPTARRHHQSGLATRRRSVLDGGAALARCDVRLNSIEVDLSTGEAAMQRMKPERFEHKRRGRTVTTEDYVARDLQLEREA